jgi:hypothetical protein
MLSMILYQRPQGERQLRRKQLFANFRVCEVLAPQFLGIEYPESKPAELLQRLVDTWPFH